jgi:hypothetical protein
MLFTAPLLAIWGLLQGVGAQCNLTEAGLLTINGTDVSCGESKEDIESFLVVTGVGSAESSVTNAQVTILMQSVSSSSALRISGSNVMLLFDGTVTFGGVFCEGESNVTLGAIGAGSLVTVGNPGLGPRGGSVCRSLSIVNGSIWAEGLSGSAGMGTGAGSSRIESLTIENANVTGSSSAGGS